jgi:hypothetical protein
VVQGVMLHLEAVAVAVVQELQVSQEQEAMVEMV